MIFLAVVDTYNVLATDYTSYASVYSCSIVPILGIKFEYGFILSWVHCLLSRAGFLMKVCLLRREKTIKPETLQLARKAFSDIGVDVSKFITVRQNC